MDIYKNNQFSRDKANKFSENIVTRFEKHFSLCGYTKHNSIAVTSDVDPSVRFIGSHISVLKQHLLKKNLPDPGFYISQDCIRTQNVKSLYKDEVYPQWGSYFKSLGVLSQESRLTNLCRDTFLFFTESIGINEESIRLRINSNDHDLLDAARLYFNDNFIELDTQVPSYYKHKIGVREVSGRSFNIALRDTRKNDFADVGNIILLETSKEVLGIELALGVSTILKQIYGLDHVNDSYPLLEIETNNITLKRKLEDALVVSVILWREGLRPIATGGRGRILRSYLRSILYYCTKLNIKVESLVENIKVFESKQYAGISASVSSEIINYVYDYKKYLLQSPKDSLEDKIIFETIISGL